LQGMAKTDEEKEAIADRAGRVAGSANIYNRIVVDNSPARPENER
jgi:hypothetical protein